MQVSHHWAARPTLRNLVIEDTLCTSSLGDTVHKATDMKENEDSKPFLFAEPDNRSKENEKIMCETAKKTTLPGQDFFPITTPLTCTPPLDEPILWEEDS